MADGLFGQNSFSISEMVTEQGDLSVAYKYALAACLRQMGGSVVLTAQDFSDNSDCRVQIIKQIDPPCVMVRLVKPYDPSQV